MNGKKTLLGFGLSRNHLLVGLHPIGGFSFGCIRFDWNSSSRFFIIFF